MLSADDELALNQAMSLVREVMDRHWQELNTQIIQRFNEAMDDIVRVSKMLREEKAG